MAVDKLFWDDPYLTSCDAVVTGVYGGEVTLDRTVAFAFSGGQASDIGTIGGREILSARCDGLEIRYRLADEELARTSARADGSTKGRPLAAGDPVVVRIDPVHRSRVMRLHFAAELVLETVYRHHDRPAKIGADIRAGKARVDFAWDGSIAPVLPAVAEEVARIVAADLPITSAFSDVATQQRYWEIAGFARVPCGGTHPRRTGEVGEVTLRRDNIGAGKERIEIRLVEP